MKFRNGVFRSLVCLILLLTLTEAARAEAQIEKGPHHQGVVSSVNLGIRYSSLLENRGVVMYRDFQIDPVLGVFLFDDKVEFLGDSLGFRDFIAGDWLRWRTRIASITDDPLFPKKASIKAGAPDRKDTYEWSNRLEFFLPGYNQDYLAELDLGYAQDISAHKGQYLDIQSKVKLYRFRMPLARTLIEPNLYSSLGWGDAKHNAFFYGSNRRSAGFNNFSFGLWFAFPEEADRYFPIIQIRRFRTMGKYSSGFLSNNRSEGWLISAIATVGVW